MSARIRLIIVLCALGASLALLLALGVRHVADIPTAPSMARDRGLPTSDVHAPPDLRTSETGRPERDSSPASRIIEVLDPNERPIAAADVYLCDRIERVVRTAERHALGRTEADGRLVVPATVLLDAPSAHIAARALDHLPSSVAIAGAGDGIIRIHLAPAFRQRVCCVDLHGEPVEGIVVMLSRLGIPPMFCAGGRDADLEPGFDPVYAMYSTETDRQGFAEFGELRRGRYQVQIQCEYYEQVSAHGVGHWIEVPEQGFEIRVTPMLCGVVKVVGDEMYSYSVTTSARDWLWESGFTRSLDSLRRRLMDRYPDSLVYACGHASADTTTTSVKAELLLARAGKRVVELPLVPAYAFDGPVVVEVDPDGPAGQAVSVVTFNVHDRVGRTVLCKDLHVFREKSVLPISKVVTPGEAMRLPYGRWSITTQKDILKGHFEPKTFDLTRPEESVEIQLDIELVPVRIETRAYRGQEQNGGLLGFTQYGLNDQIGTMQLDQLVLWLRPGDTDWYFGTDNFYEPFRRSIPVQPMPDGDVQTIVFDLVLSQGR